MDENSISRIVIGAAISVHSELGPGLLESSYQESLCYELTERGLYVEKEKPMPLVFKSIHLECGYRVDLLVVNKLVIEVKAVEKTSEVHLAQVLTYLRLSDCRLGLLLNFHVARMKEGIRRVVNGLKDTPF
ncbi:MAG: GxxExxY protein [Acidobacteria bacterium]|nr:MAG: GxxExxY protein [Acidobacteriota bacterium]REK04200.1 MAG: GxxExxY protein [Acidobacteriota bacterium]REK15362.1 MAG: GxxExxY protein [Acidobacteriota bacterium]REK46452.1 MAG: GxxExxY protein [Acidobacteriota bacterium]